MAEVYLDYNATTPLDPTVLEAISHSLRDLWSNPSSSYPAGMIITCIHVIIALVIISRNQLNP